MRQYKGPGYRDKGLESVGPHDVDESKLDNDRQTGGKFVKVAGALALVGAGFGVWHVGGNVVDHIQKDMSVTRAENQARENTWQIAAPAREASHDVFERFVNGEVVSMEHNGTHLTIRLPEEYRAAKQVKDSGSTVGYHKGTDVYIDHGADLSQDPAGFAIYKVHEDLAEQLAADGAGNYGAENDIMISGVTATLLDNGLMTGATKDKFLELVDAYEQPTASYAEASDIMDFAASEFAKELVSGDGEVTVPDLTTLRVES